MKRISICLSIILVFLASCASGFDVKRATTLLEKRPLTEKDITEMLEIYENGIDDAISYSQKNPNELSKNQREEIKLIFAIGMRLSKEESNMTSSQRSEFQRINLKGTEEEDR